MAKRFKEAKNLIMQLLAKSLPNDCMNFVRTSDGWISFEYNGEKFETDPYLIVYAGRNVEGRRVQTTASKLMTKLLYSDHKEQINKWYSEG